MMIGMNGLMSAWRAFRWFRSSKLIACHVFYSTAPARRSYLVYRVVFLFSRLNVLVRVKFACEGGKYMDVGFAPVTYDDETIPTTPAAALV
jgi:hypothetical protein